MSKQTICNMKLAQAIFGALGVTLITCSTAMAAAVLTIQGPADNDGQFNGGGTVIDCATVPGADHGIDLNSVYNAHVHSYEIKNCEVGVRISGGSGNHLNDLYIHHNSEDGIRLAGNTTKNHINGSNVSNNGGFGINLKTGSNENQFNTMFVNGNGAGGYNCDNSTQNVITSNELIRNGNYGVILQSGCTYTTVRGGIITYTAGTGIDVSGDYNILQGNVVTGSSDEGIKLRSNANWNLVQSNTASQNGEQGIENAGDNNKFKSNTVNENGDQGIQMELGAITNVIKSNTALNNGDNDLEDLNLNCVSNSWSSNTFGSTDPGCIN